MTNIWEQNNLGNKLGLKDYLPGGQRKSLKLLEEELELAKVKMDSLEKDGRIDTKEYKMAKGVFESKNRQIEALKKKN